MKKGLTQVELLLAIGILAILLSLGTIVFGNFVRKDQLLVEVKKIESIINEAKLKTMIGFSLGGTQSLNFGVYFQTNGYVLFSGLAYDPQDSHNQEFVLPPDVEISWISFTSNCILFEKISGEVFGFDSNQNYIIVRGKNSNEKKKITVNQLGTVKIEDL